MSMHKSKQHKIFAFFHLVVCAFLLVSCDPVSVDDRYIEMEAIDAQRCVLLEEFTGQNCVNCPTAHRTIEALQKQYGSSLISVSIHAGSFAFPEGQFGDLLQTFKTPEGDEYAAMWGITTYPSGVINRRGSVLGFADWASIIRSELERPAGLNIELSASVDEDKLIAAVTLKPTTAIEGHLQLWVVEDGIVSLQVDGGATLRDYVHNNVYRASMNGVGGTAVSLQANVFATENFSIDVRKNWSVDNLSIVAFVYDQSGVQQAVRVPLHKND